MKIIRNRKRKADKLHSWENSKLKNLIKLIKNE